MKPSNMEIGILNIFMPIFMLAPLYKPKKTLNIVIAKTSSMDAPAIMRLGTLFSVPILLLIKLSIEGTTTAGDTAARIKPSMPP
ncbi:hypothetical protein SDC9_191465 [bioreactor metagenome]|uniref:Uncharacterized protein n=1 Tax=bioreactor metagenome TaxID=1076179 RepID=A0A645I685_9ZZZZ